MTSCERRVIGLCTGMFFARSACTTLGMVYNKTRSTEKVLNSFLQEVYPGIISHFLHEQQSRCLLPCGSYDTSIPISRPATRATEEPENSRSAGPSLSFAEWRLGACVVPVRRPITTLIPLLEFEPPHERQFPAETYIFPPEKMGLQKHFSQAEKTIWKPLSLSKWKVFCSRKIGLLLLSLKTWKTLTQP